MSDLAKTVPLEKPNEYTVVVGDPVYDIKLKVHNDRFPGLIAPEAISVGDFIDLRAAEEYNLSKGDFAIISLGVSMELPEGFFAMLVPRSSTFKNFGIIQVNSPGIIDESYKGDNDIWLMPVLATRDVHIEKNQRICQFAIFEKNRVNLNLVDSLNNKDRGGLGSTGIN